MVKFTELTKADLQFIVNDINIVFKDYNIDKESVRAFWECVEVGNKKMDGA